ncbi:lipopolysaccharide biosynthesis protein [Oleisolibacter albus]|uniref:lipopolysaccharide biosynthesis protein n=1 Tax=Oleisolibacter albus TaxID=2171757 RepID=UPI00138FA8A3|nr:lipopolysaccharide biosynthesis protein [Oleisolibacter albus]
MAEPLPTPPDPTMPPPRWFADQRLRRLFSNAGILLGGKGFNALFSLAGLAIAARALGAEEFGVLVLIHTFTQAIGEIAKFQSWQAVIRYGTPALDSGDRPAFQRLLRFTVLLDGVSALAGMVLSVLIAWFVGPHLHWPAEVMPAALIYVTSVLFMVTATPTGVLRLVDRFSLLSVQGTLGWFVRMAAGLAVWLAGGGLVAFLAAWYLATVVAGLFLIAAGWRELRTRGLLEGFRWRGEGPMTHGFPGIWSFVWSTNLNSTLELAFTHVGTLVVGWMMGSTEAGLFRVARQVADGVAKPAKLLVPAIYPELARLAAAGDRASMRHLIERSALIAGAGATALMLVAALLGKPLLSLVLGPEFVSAYGVMLWLIAAAVVGIWSFPLEPMLISNGQAGTATRIRAWTSALYIPALFLALDHAGLAGAGWVRLAVAVLMFAAFLRPVLRWFRQPAVQSAG